jgi:hypothetical protein
MSRLEPGDYYFEDGLMVFTRQYHLKRGRCCNCGCRHCPWADGEIPVELASPKPPVLPLSEGLKPALKPMP